MSTQTNNSTFIQSMNGINEINTDNVITSAITADSVTSTNLTGGTVQASSTLILPDTSLITSTNTLVNTTTDQTISGIKSFSSDTNTTKIIFSRQYIFYDSDASYTC